MKFYLGAHQPHWLALSPISLMVSRRSLARYKTMPRTRAPWIRDSGGFTELFLYGSWQRVPMPFFITEARRHVAEIGQVAHLAPQDWMCEPVICRKTGLTVAEHQRRTVANFVELRDQAPELPWMPVLQGWTADDYLRCIELYDRAGVGLAAEPLVGVGTVCRRQAMDEAVQILARIADAGIVNLHGFGFKLQGLRRCAGLLASSDSLAWSYEARRAPPLPGHTHKNCANCWEYAERWYGKVAALIERHQDAPYQLVLAL